MPPATPTPAEPLMSAPPARRRRPAGDQQVVLRGIGWDGYRKLLKMRGERPVPRIVYLDGDAWLMSPSFPHESYAERLGALLAVVVEELRIPCVLAGGTTLRQKAKKAGVEGDKTFYLANALVISRKAPGENIDLKVDPPPDLAIEVVWTHTAAQALKVYGRLRVPEVWVWEAGELRILVRQQTGRYVRSEASHVLPFLTAAEITTVITTPPASGPTDSDWLRDVRAWVRDVLTPRAKATNTNS